MSRSGYTDDMDDDLAMGRWRAQVMSATRGKRGQRMFSDLLLALDAMPEKALIIGELKTEQGDVCALGALAIAKGVDVSRIDPDEPEQVAAAFDIAPQLAAEVVYMNDEYCDDRWDDTAKCFVPLSAEEMWTKMRAWVSAQIKQGAPAVAAPQAEE